ncbi:MAG: HTH domain-containing protein [Cytophagales bacterium]|nr:HTH domain-containing protein [Cytophagales bacterium]
MNYIQKIERLQKLNKLIEQGRTGTPDELAQQLGISRSKMYEVLDDLKSLGKEVKYNRVSKTFYYVDDIKLDIKFSMKLIEANETGKIAGGFQFFSSVLFSGRSAHTLAIPKGWN